MICDVCKSREAVIYQPHTRRRLCSKCFTENIVSRVKKEIEKYEMIKPNDRILLAVSGGKDSFVLLDVLSRIHDPSRLIGLSIIEGIEGYNRAEYIDRLKKYARERGIDVVVTSFKEEVGASLSELVEKAVKKSINVSPCTFCGTIRRRIMNMYARKLNVNKLATAHNLDDEAAVLLSNYVSANVELLARQSPVLPRRDGMVSRIKPLFEVSERETALYAHIQGLSPISEECPYAVNPSTLKFKEVINFLEEKWPAAKVSMVRGFLKRIKPHLTDEGWQEALRRCAVCGYPTSSEVCAFCRLKEAYGPM